MNPSFGPELMLVDVGNGGEDDVNVVARRVGLNLREDAWEGRSRPFSIPPAEEEGTDLALPQETIIAEIHKHGSLSLRQIFCRVFLDIK